MTRQRARIIDGPPEMMERVRKYEKVTKNYSEMSLEDKIVEREVLRAEIRTIEKKLVDKEFRIDILENMQDVARRRVEESEDLTSMLYGLRNNTLDIGEFLSDKPKRMYLMHNLELLRRAGYVDYDGSPKDFKVTEDGYAFQYDGRFEQDGR